ncbi:MAG: ATP-dependent sacrificial sulfur transferase LarE [Desulfovibrionaceae bacterium]|nr:ATP-dependent sacrificial sulfur transferase LarE [Desulfovibrionaceae bacterium]
MDLEFLVARLTEAVDGGWAVVALSGGVDSGLVALAARKALGTGCVAATAVSELTPARELGRAEALARHIGLPFRAVPVSVLGDPLVRANGPDRCYHCKRLIFRVLREEFGPDAVFFDGTNADDDPHRPGLKALREHGVRSPLREAGLGKRAVRELARRAGLPNHDTPSESCLATRIPRGIALDADNLKVVECLESQCHEMGADTLRVHYDNLVAIMEYLPQYADIMEQNRDSLMALALRIGVGSCLFKEYAE